MATVVDKIKRFVGRKQPLTTLAILATIHLVVFVFQIPLLEAIIIVIGLLLVAWVIKNW